MSKILFIIGHPDLANDSVVTKEVVNILKSEFPVPGDSILSELCISYSLCVRYSRKLRRFFLIEFKFCSDYLACKFAGLLAGCDGMT